MFWAAILYKYHDSTSLGNPTNTARVLNILSLNEFKAINATIWIGKSIFKPFIFYDRNIVNILSPSSMWTLRGSIQPESGPIHRWELCGFIHLSSLPCIAAPVRNWFFWNTRIRICSGHLIAERGTTHYPPVGTLQLHTPLLSLNGLNPYQEGLDSDPDLPDPNLTSY